MAKTFDEMFGELDAGVQENIKRYTDSRVTAAVQTYRENHRSEGAQELEAAYNDRLSAIENKYVELEAERTSDSLIANFCITNRSLTEKQIELAKGCKSADPEDTKRRLQLLQDSIAEDHLTMRQELAKQYGRSIDGVGGAKPSAFSGDPGDWSPEKMQRARDAGVELSKLKRDKPYTAGETSRSGWHRPNWGGKVKQSI